MEVLSGEMIACLPSRYEESPNFLPRFVGMNNVEGNALPLCGNVQERDSATETIQAQACLGQT